jgi:hypothetical protein
MLLPDVDVDIPVINIISTFDLLTFDLFLGTRANMIHRHMFSKHIFSLQIHVVCDNFPPMNSPCW